MLSRDGPPETQGRQGALKLKSGDNSFDGLPRLIDPTSCVADHQPERGAIMAKRRKGSKVQKRKGATAHPKARKVSKAARGKAKKRTVASAKPKPAPVKKAARRMKQPVDSAVETVAVEVIEQPAAVTAVEETRQAS
jgi:hypothetical protein